MTKILKIQYLPHLRSKNYEITFMQSFQCGLSTILITCLNFPIYIWRKFFCLFCFSCWNIPNHGAFCHALGNVGKPSTHRGAWSWFHNVLIYYANVIEYWIKFSLKIHLNWIPKIIGEFGHSLDGFGKPSMRRI
jgi:hypothetical protein